MDVFSESKLQLVHPELNRLIHKMEVMLGEPITVQQGFRSYAQQARIYAQGRTTPGPIVSNAPPGHSYHEFGLAVDVCPVSLLGEKNWCPESNLWIRLKQIGLTLGLTPGATFTKPDLPHFQLTGKFPVSPDDQVRAIYEQNGMIALWQESGIPGSLTT